MLTNNEITHNDGAAESREAALSEKLILFIRITGVILGLVILILGFTLVLKEYYFVKGIIDDPSPEKIEIVKKLANAFGATQEDWQNADRPVPVIIYALITFLIICVLAILLTLSLLVNGAKVIYYCSGDILNIRNRLERITEGLRGIGDKIRQIELYRKEQ